MAMLVLLLHTFPRKISKTTSVACQVLRLDPYAHAAAVEVRVFLPSGSHLRTRATIEVLHFSSEVPRFESLRPLPKIDLEKM